MAITKAMLARCQNELKQAFCALPEDVQKAIVDNHNHAEALQHRYGFFHRPAGGFGVSYIQDKSASVFRLSPDTPTDPEWEERVIVQSLDGFLQVRGLTNCLGHGISFSTSQSHPHFLGIIYLKDGIETLRTSVDAAFGTPVRVRFSK